MSQTLVNHRIGRIILHSLCALRDHHWKWHLLGMEREFAWATISDGKRCLSGRSLWNVFTTGKQTFTSCLTQSAFQDKTVTKAMREAVTIRSLTESSRADVSRPSRRILFSQTGALSAAGTLCGSTSAVSEPLLPIHFHWLRIGKSLPRCGNLYPNLHQHLPAGQARPARDAAVCSTGKAKIYVRRTSIYP